MLFPDSQELQEEAERRLEPTTRPSRKEWLESSCGTHLVLKVYAAKTACMERIENGTFEAEATTVETARAIGAMQAYEDVLGMLTDLLHVQTEADAERETTDQH